MTFKTSLSCRLGVIALGLGVGLGLLSLAAAAATPETATPSAAPVGASELVQRGKYLATAGDCVACHTAPGGKPMAGGLAIPTPLGDIMPAGVTIRLGIRKV